MFLMASVSGPAMGEAVVRPEADPPAALAPLSVCAWDGFVSVSLCYCVLTVC